MNITDEQKELLQKHGIEISENATELLIALDEKITDVGFNADYSLNKLGHELQMLYDRLYNQLYDELEEEYRG